eukprot:2205893-Rhodomonas_salina.3
MGMLVPGRLTATSSGSSVGGSGKVGSSTVLRVCYAGYGIVTGRVLWVSYPTSGAGMGDVPCAFMPWRILDGVGTDIPLCGTDIPYAAVLRPVLTGCMVDDHAINHCVVENSVTSKGYKVTPGAALMAMRC